MTVKQFLYSVRDEQKEIEELTDRIYEMRMSLLPSGIRYDTDKVQTSPEDKLSECEAKIADYSTMLGQKKEALIQRRHRAQQTFRIYSVAISHLEKMRVNESSICDKMIG